MEQITGQKATEALLNGLILEYGERLYKYDQAEKSLLYRDLWEKDWKPSNTTPEGITKSNIFNVHES